MADSFRERVVFEFDLTGATKAIDLIRGLQRAVVETTSEVPKLEKALGRIADSATKTGTATQQASRGQQSLITSTRSVSKASGDLTANLARTRYALYDVASTYATVSAAALGAATATAAAAIAYESAFTAVERTTLDERGRLASNISQVRQELLDLSTTIPVAFSEITRIASLGAQLDIAAEDLDAFTDTVAKFAATTNVSVDTAALAFGALGQITGVAANDYNRLGSAIAYVGVNSVATESEILSVSREIAQQATSAGFAADQVVGLAGAISSLRIPPERARGSLTTYFQTLNQAIAAGGQDLANFAVVVGMTTEQLDSMVRQGRGAEVFRAFLQGLTELDNVSITQALNELDLAQLRVADSLGRLAQNVEVYDKSQTDAAKGFKEGVFLNQAFATVLDDVASQLRLLLNQFTEFLATAGQPFLGVLGAIVPVATQVLSVLTDLAQNPVAQTFLFIAGAITVAVGVFAAYQAATAFATASTYALITAQQGLAAAGVANGVRGLITTLGLYSSTAGAATVATTAFSFALRSIPFVAIAAGVVLLVDAIFRTFPTAEERVGALAERFRQLAVEQENAQSNAGFGSWVEGEEIDALDQEIQNYTKSILGAIEVQRELDRLLASTAEGINDERIAELGGTISYHNAEMQELNRSLFELRSTGNSLVSSYVIRGITEQLIESGLSAAEASRYFLEYRLAVSRAMREAVADSNNLGPLGNGLGKVATGIETVGKAASGAKGEVRTLVDYANDLAQVFSRAFDIRYAPALAVDELSDSFYALSERIDEARRALLGLTAQRDQLQYFLGVAENYGDALRSAEIRAELAELNAKIAETEADASTELRGNTRAGRANRRAIADLLRQYESYVTALAASGIEQDGLNAAVAQSKSDFIAQATALGFSSIELQQYADHFDDLVFAIARVPRNLTVAVDVNPALTAINELEASLRNLSSQTFDGPTIRNNNDNKELRRLAIEAAIVARSALIAQYASQGNVSGAVKAADWVDLARIALQTGNYASGGYTGRGGKYEPAGVVHRGEYVIPQRGVDQSTGLPRPEYVAQLTRGSTGSNGGYAGGGLVRNSGPMLVQLVASDLHRLASGQPIILSVDGKQLAATVNSTNEMTSLRGGN